MAIKFGKTTTGASWQSFVDIIVGDYGMAPVKGRPVSITAYHQFAADPFRDTTFNYCHALYNYGGGGNPTMFVGSTAAGAVRLRAGSVATGWGTLSFKEPKINLKSHTNYFICTWCETDQLMGVAKLAYSHYFLAHGFIKPFAYSKAWPTIILGETAQARLYSIYCTMTQDTRPGQYVSWTP